MGSRAGRVQSMTDVSVWRKSRWFSATAISGALLGCLAAYLCRELGLREAAGGPFAAWIAALAALSWIAAAYERIRYVTMVNAALLLGCLLVRYTPLADVLARQFVRREHVRGDIAAVVVTAGGTTSQDVLNVVSVSRLLDGLALAKSLGRPLITTEEATGSRPLARQDRRELVELAGLQSQWESVGMARSTREEAVLVGDRLLRSATPKIHIAVVTSPIHSRRACATFEARGFTVTCVPARDRLFNTETPRVADDRVRAFQDLIYETAAAIYYRARGWIT